MNLKDQNDKSNENDINKDVKSTEADLDNNKYYDFNLTIYGQIFLYIFLNNINSIIANS